VFDTNFNPYDALVNMDRNLQALIAAHNGLAKRVEEQGHVIDVLIEGLNNSNKANEVLMREMASSVMDKLKEVK
jgi:hypothetical protein